MRYPIIVEQAWHALDHLAEDLQIWPCRYDTEADIQAEFVRRLVNALEATGFDTFQGQVVDASGGEPEISTFSRVGCQHGVRDREHGGITHPDVVLYDDLPDPTDWPKDAWMWPILMAIEFKYGYTRVVTHRTYSSSRALSRRARRGTAAGSTYAAAPTSMRTESCTTRWARTTVCSPKPDCGVPTSSPRAAAEPLEN